ncbi:hypothetical protein, partial [Actinomadura sp. NPDC049753]|uniref:GlsB/YeaQ/YmgE family stress response membrane protein n=1 Tax=Actinomadura sp. NPDC049753 TaxID=3154739 RepID=UPI00342FC093
MTRFLFQPGRQGIPITDLGRPAQGKERLIEMLTTILWFIVVGAVIGALARLVVPGRNPIGILLTVLVGIAGAILGGVVADALGAGMLVALRSAKRRTSRSLAVNAPSLKIGCPNRFVVAV